MSFTEHEKYAIARTYYIGISGTPVHPKDYELMKRAYDELGEQEFQQLVRSTLIDSINSIGPSTVQEPLPPMEPRPVIEEDRRLMQQMIDALSPKEGRS